MNDESTAENLPFDKFSEISFVIFVYSQLGIYAYTDNKKLIIASRVQQVTVFPGTKLRYTSHRTNFELRLVICFVIHEFCLSV